MRKIYFLLFSIMLACAGCQWHLRSGSPENGDNNFSIERFDQLERHFLTSGDIAAMQQMNTEYPVETRMLIENVLRLGHVDEPDINTRFLTFFQDSTLQTLIRDVEHQYADLSDVERSLSVSFARLEKMIPTLQTPRVYTQIGSLDQSIVVGDGLLGISLDKYLGTNHPVYLRYGYTEEQRSMMNRKFIVSDCLAFYLLSLYPYSNEEHARKHMAKIQYVVAKALNIKSYTNEDVKNVERYMAAHPDMSISELLTDYTEAADSVPAKE